MSRALFGPAGRKCSLEASPRRCAASSENRRPAAVLAPLTDLPVDALTADLAPWRFAQEEVAIVGTVHSAEIHDAEQQRGLI